jgi:hypothetical protein
VLNKLQNTDALQLNLSAPQALELAHALITHNAYGQVTKKSWVALAEVEQVSMEQKWRHQEHHQNDQQLDVMDMLKIFECMLHQDMWLNELSQYSLLFLD